MRRAPIVRGYQRRGTRQAQQPRAKVYLAEITSFGCACMGISRLAGASEAATVSGRGAKIPGPFPFCGASDLTSLFASNFEKNLAVSSMAAKVVASSANCIHPLSVAAFPSSVNPAKQKGRCTQKTSNEACPSKTNGRTASGFKVD